MDFGWTWARGGPEIMLGRTDGGAWRVANGVEARQVRGAGAAAQQRDKDEEPPTRYDGRCVRRIMDDKDQPPVAVWSAAKTTRWRSEAPMRSGGGRSRYSALVAELQM